MTAYIFKIITLLGGLSLFLFGMDVMGKSLERQAGGKLQTILAKMSSNVFKGEKHIRLGKPVRLQERIDKHNRMTKEN